MSQGTDEPSQLNQLSPFCARLPSKSLEHLSRHKLDTSDACVTVDARRQLNLAKEAATGCREGSTPLPPPSRTPLHKKMNGSPVHVEAAARFFLPFIFVVIEGTGREI